MGTMHEVPYVIGVAITPATDGTAMELGMAAARYPVSPGSQPERIWFAAYRVAGPARPDATVRPSEQYPHPATDAALAFALATLAAENSFCVWDAGQRKALGWMYGDSIRPPAWGLVRLVSKEMAARGASEAAWSQNDLSAARRALIVAEWGARMHSPYPAVEAVT